MTQRRNAREIDPALLRQLIDYDPETGVMIWKPRDASLFSDGSPGGVEAAAKRWNKRYSGKPALAAIQGDGYRIGKILDVNYSAHRVAFAWHYGYWPSEQIDHINGYRSDNRIANLREASRVQNGRNQARHNINAAGHIGVCFNASEKKYYAHIGVNGKRMHLGLFTDKADAIAARKAAEMRYGFHPNHGADNRPRYGKPKAKRKPKASDRQGVFDFGD